jgi:tetratricopeptide (TPR) repeat protein
MDKRIRQLFLLMLLLSVIRAYRNSEAPSQAAISQLNLKSGEVATCGDFSNKKYGKLAFETSCPPAVKKDFELAMQLLHSFEYDEAEKVFAGIIGREPSCAMAYWGVAMSNFHPLWTPPNADELKKGSGALHIARSLKKRSAREAQYINAIGAYYDDYNQSDHKTRCLRFEKAMRKLYVDFPGDTETAVFYALALNAAADPADKSFARQKQAGAILNKLEPGIKDHPGIVHYLIHTYDSPELATLALPAARRYAGVAPSSAHAVHMPSHIFTRLGLWQEAINSNLASVSSAQCYAESAGMKGHWDEELHGIDYLVYAYLQKGDNDNARRQWDYLNDIREVHPVNFKVAYAFAAVPSRYLLENKLWREAAALKTHNPGLIWADYPWQHAIVNFTRLLGSVHTGDIKAARSGLQALLANHKALARQKDDYKANQVMIQLKASEAWILFKEGRDEQALELMSLAADMENKTEKHPVTPSEVIPARELLGDMLMEMGKPVQALEAYEAVLRKHPNRFNALYGAGTAARRSGKAQVAAEYYRTLLSFVNKDSRRPEVKHIREYLAI